MLNDLAAAGLLPAGISSVAWIHTAGAFALGAFLIAHPPGRDRRPLILHWGRRCRIAACIGNPRARASASGRRAPLTAETGRIGGTWRTGMVCALRVSDAETLRPMKNVKRSLAGQRLGVFGRGGSGKSTCVVLLARALARAGYPVCVVDADSTNEGLAQALGADTTPASLLDWFGGTVFSGGPVTCPVDDPVPMAGAHLTPGQLPAKYWGQTPEGIRVFLAGKIGPLGPGAGCDGPMTKIARDFAFEPEGEAPVTVLDFKAGIEDASRGVITSLDWVIVVMDPTYAAVRAAVTMKTLIEQLHTGFLPATQHLASPAMVELTRRTYREARTQGALYVLNKVPDADTEHYLWQRLLEAEIQVAASIPDDPALRRAWLEGTSLCSAAAEAEAAKLVSALEERRGTLAGAGALPTTASSEAR